MTEVLSREELIIALRDAKTQTIQTWGDAAQFLGLDPVSVQTTPLDERMLCRVTAQGKALLEDYWGVAALSVYGTSGEGTAWGDESLGYVTLNRTELQALVVFCAARTECYRGFVLYNNKCLVLLPTQRYVDLYAKNKDMLMVDAALFEFVKNSRNYKKIF